MNVDMRSLTSVAKAKRLNVDCSSGEQAMRSATASEVIGRLQPMSCALMRLPRFGLRDRQFISWNWNGHSSRNCPGLSAPLPYLVQDGPWASERTMEDIN
jgi:hypothetical protein